MWHGAYIFLSRSYLNNIPIVFVFQILLNLIDTYFEIDHA